jgi:hypothetical protein
MSNDPDQLSNVVDQPTYRAVRQNLASRLNLLLKESGDPRAIGGGKSFDEYPYLGGAPRHPDFAGTEKHEQRVP